MNSQRPDFQNNDNNQSTSINPSKRFRCTFCSKTFSSKHCLTEHKYKHSNINPYKCSYCWKYFRHASQLSLHKSIHLKREKSQISFGVAIGNILNYKSEESKTQNLFCTLPLIGNSQVFQLPLHEGLESNLILLNNTSL